MIGIYKIENKINGKCYIGQSVNIKKRWHNEIISANNPNDSCYNYPLSLAFRKYGVENFSFEIVEECKREDLNDREKYWISKYNSYNQGYNQTPGGDSVLHMSKLTPQKALEIIEILSNDKEGKISHRQLAKDYGVSTDTIQGINAGRQWYNDKYSYPLHISQFDERRKKKNYCVDCGQEIYKTSFRCMSCANKNLITKKPIEREELKRLIRIKPFTQIGKDYNVSDNAIRKWCKTYNLPPRKKDINSYSDEEWEKI